MRLSVHRVFDELCHLAAEARRVFGGSSGEVHPAAVTGENHVRPVRPRARPAPTAAPPLQPRKVDCAPGCHRRPLAPRGAVLAAVKGAQLTGWKLKQPLEPPRSPYQRAGRILYEHRDAQFQALLNDVTR